MDVSADLPMPQLDLLDVQAWSVYWTEMERRIAPVFPDLKPARGPWRIAPAC